MLKNLYVSSSSIEADTPTLFSLQCILSPVGLNELSLLRVYTCQGVLAFSVRVQHARNGIKKCFLAENSV